MKVRARINHRLPLGASLNIFNPGDGWSVDFLILDSSFKNYAVLICCDITSNYLAAISLTDKATSKEIIYVLSTHIISHYGNFLCLGSYAQSLLVSQTMTEICQIMRCRRFIVSHPQQSNAERAHKFIIWMMGAIKVQTGISDEMMPVYLAHCALLYNTSTRVHDKFSPYFLMNGVRSPHLSKLVPFSSFLPNKKNVDTNYLKCFIKVREALTFINYERRKLHREKMGLKENFQQSLRPGDLVSVTRARPQGLRAGHKLRPIFYSEVYKICKLYHRTAIVIKYNKNMAFQKIFKQKGGCHKSEFLSLDRNRLKEIKNPAAHLGFDMTEKLWVQIGSLLNKNCPPSNHVYLLTMQNQVEDETDLNKFVLHFDKETAIFNDLSPNYREHLITNRTLLLEYHINRKTKQDNSLNNSLSTENIICYSAGRITGVLSIIVR